MLPRHTRIRRLGLGGDLDLHAPWMVPRLLVMARMLMMTRMLVMTRMLMAGRRARMHPRHLVWHGPLAVNDGLDLVLRHALRLQTLAQCGLQRGFGLLVLLLLLGGLLDLLGVPALYGLVVGLFACCGGGFGGLLLLELGEGVFFDDAVALGFLFLGLVDCGEGWMVSACEI